MESVQQLISEGKETDLRLFGPSGIGKTRLAMEALRDQPFTALVGYVPNAGAADGMALTALVNGGYTLILVVDECDARQHEKLAEQIPVDSSVRLITIGPGDDERDYPLKNPLWLVEGLDDNALDAFLQANFPQLSQEARRTTTQFAARNVRLAGVLAKRIVTGDTATVAEIIRSGDLNQLLALTIPEGEDFFLACALALFERVGVEGDLASQLEAVASYAGVTEDRLRQLLRHLERDGVVEQQGRYRAIDPEPLAVYLAASCWTNDGDRIVTELFPALPDELKTSLLRRAAQLGRYGPARLVLSRLFDDESVLGSLRVIDERGLSELLIHLAIVAPEESARRLSQMITTTPLEELGRLRGVRRNLVWALEKLVWHSTTFEQSANALLRLALAENETYGNNATGRWLSLFATLLPASGAGPVQRFKYLSEQSRSTNPKVRCLVVRACSSGLSFHESVDVSGEIQGGSVVEPRGRPSTWGEATDYQAGLVGLLRTGVDDSDPDVASASRDALFKTVHPFIDNQLLWPRLQEVLLSLTVANQRLLGNEVRKLIRMRYRGAQLTTNADEPVQEDAVLRHLERFAQQLPQPSAFELLKTEADRTAWDFDGDDEARARLSELVREVVSEHGVETVIAWLISIRPQSGWFVGYALSGLAEGEASRILTPLVDGMDNTLAPLAGFLTAQVDGDSPEAFDQFFESNQGKQLDQRQQLALAVRGPATDSTKNRVLTSVKQLSVAEGVATLFGWQRNITSDEAEELIGYWSGQLSSQPDYNAIVVWLSVWLPGADVAEVPSTLRDDVWRVVQRRKDFPELAQERWNWCRLAGSYLVSHAQQLAQLVLDLVSSDTLTFLDPDFEEAILRRAAQQDPQSVWQELATRLENHDWRVQMSLRGSVTEAFPVELIRDWIGASVDRARLVATIATVGETEPTGLAKHLLGAFSNDAEIASSLRSEFVSGSWMGSHSDRLSEQINHLQQWQRSPDEPEGLKAWAAELAQALESERRAVLQWEAEGRW
jgi:hypothetical protein